MRHIILNPEYDTPDLRNFIHQLPDSFSSSGKEIYSGRNVVKEIMIGNGNFIVKRFKKLSPLRAILYLLRKSKAERAYTFGLKILERGFITPIPVATVDIKRGPLLYDSYFISTPLYADDLTFMRNAQFNPNDAKRLADFIYALQQNGILHGDLNMTNILLVNEREMIPEKRFAVIDTNRSRILRKSIKPSLKMRARNIMRVTHRRDLLRALLQFYPMQKKEKDTLSHLVFRALLQQERQKKILHSIFPH